MKKLFRCILISFLFLTLHSHHSFACGEGVEVYVNSAAINSGAWYTISYTNETRDDSNFHSSSPNPSRLTVPSGHAGWYVVHFHYVSQSTYPNSVYSYAGIYKNGNIETYQVINYYATLYHRGMVVDVEYLNVGDYVESKLYISAGSGLLYNCYFSMVLVGGGSVPAHAEQHENDGGDEINVGGLSGTLADEQDAGWLQSYPLDIGSLQAAQKLHWSGSAWENTFAVYPHADQHEDGGMDEINVGGLSGLLADPQDAGWLQDLAISTTDPTDAQVLVWNDTGSQWEPSDLGEATLPDFITVTLSGTVPVVITSTYHYTAELNSGHDIAVTRSFTYGEMAIAIGLFCLLALFSLKWVFELVK